MLTSAKNSVEEAANDMCTADELRATMLALDPFFREHAAENEKLGRLAPPVIELLATHNIHLLLVPKALGGLEMSPIEAMRVLEQIAWSDPSTGWVAFVICTGTAMAAGFLPDSGVAHLFGEGGGNIICGSGAPTGRATKVDGGYQVSGRWSYGSAIQHAHWHHSGAMLFEDGKPKLDEAGVPIMMIIHAPTDTLSFEGNWDTLGLRATGSIDYAENGVFVPEELIFLLKDATAKRNEAFYGIGSIGLTSIGHSAWAAGVGRRMLDEIAKLAREKSAPAMKTSTKALSDSEAFWEEYGASEGRVRSAQAFLYETWSMVEERIAGGVALSTRDMTLVRLALNTITTAAGEAADFAYKAGSGASLRNGILQRVFRDIYTGKQHVTVSPGVLRNCGRELAGLADGKVWALYELADSKK
ncbi:acyl-CoA dehydrogenase family protein [Sphingobium lactosutens]|uniref:acyl-CoA dehydrogenase family protein n=1 Tax=Sphingobium lactosutens TaxID=522773 RepID=UPI0015C0B2FC|nr:acyl-CoA dehydrogenase [Sphingobium lactosutens]